MFRFAFLLLLSFGVAMANSDLDSGNYWFENRALHSKNDRADSAVVEKMIRAYKRALKDSAVEEIAAEKLLYAYYFKGCHAVFDHKVRLKLFAESKKFGEEMHATFRCGLTNTERSRRSRRGRRQRSGTFRSKRKTISFSVARTSFFPTFPSS